MKNPKSFGGLFGVFVLSMAITTVVYVTIGFFGFWKYGSDAKDSITLNLPTGDVYVFNLNRENDFIWLILA